MPRLIDADEAYKVLTDYYHHKTEIQHKALKEAIGKVPTVDIDAITESHERTGYDRGFRDGYAQATSEVRHGHWTRNDNGTYSCSECKSWIPNEQHYYARYCLFCGAIMDVEKENETG